MGATLFAKNLIRLLKFDLKAHHKAIKKYADYEYMLDNLKYEICDEVKSLRLPKVLGQKELQKSFAINAAWFVTEMVSLT